MSENFNEAEEFWYLDKLYQDLSEHKVKDLTRMEKLHLRGLLSGFSPNQIALKLNKDVDGVQADLSKTIYAYIKSLLGKASEEKIENWRCIPKWLEDKGYRKPLQRNTPHFPVDNLDAIVKLVSFENNSGVYNNTNTFTVEINISFQTSLPSNSSETQTNSCSVEEKK
jgi:hypothetical protein